MNNALQAWEERLQCEEGGALTAKLVAFMLRRLNCVSAAGGGNERESLMIKDKLLNHMINKLRIYSLLICDLRHIHKNSWKKNTDTNSFAELITIFLKVSLLVSKCLT